MFAEASRFYDEFPIRMREAARETPEVSRAFTSLFQSVMADGALTGREKELIALAIATAVRCLPCINTHAQKALHAGASRQQVVEAATVAILMQGGPSYSYLPYVMDALNAVEARGPVVEEPQGAHADT